jgi:hypothetical protein
MTTYQERRAATENASGSKDTLGRNCYEHRHPESKAPTSITHQNNELILLDRSLNIVKPLMMSREISAAIPNWNSPDLQNKNIKCSGFKGVIQNDSFFITSISLITDKGCDDEAT